MNYSLPQFSFNKHYNSDFVHVGDHFWAYSINKHFNDVFYFQLTGDHDCNLKKIHSITDFNQTVLVLVQE